MRSRSQKGLSIKRSGRSAFSVGGEATDCTLSAYARQAQDIDLVEWATEIKVRAERKRGELLRESAKNGERATAKTARAVGSDRTMRVDIPTLSELGISPASFLSLEKTRRDARRTLRDRRGHRQGARRTGDHCVIHDTSEEYTRAHDLARIGKHLAEDSANTLGCQHEVLQGINEVLDRRASVA